MTWQKRARLVLAIFGIVFAGVVFFAIGEREKPNAAPAPERLDPNAVLETSRGLMNRVTGSRLDFSVTFDRQLAYEDSVSKLYGVRIEVKERQGRDFVVTGAEALANEKAREVRLTGNVKLTASDGFQLTTDTATFGESDGVVRAPGPIAFSKGGMSGTGRGMSYDKNTDVLTITDQAQVKLVDEAGATAGEFSAGTATLSRHDNYLLLEGAVHAIRGEQTIDADKATATLTEDEEAITYIELRGNARVAGGSASFDVMRARDIDLDYSDDGLVLERIVLTGGGSIGLKTPSGAPGRQMAAESLTLSFAPDGALTSAIGRDKVQLDMPATDGTSARHVRARTLDAAGEPGIGMTAARFTGDVEYREEAPENGSSRTARSRALDVRLDGDEISSAIFTGGVQFEEQSLEASGAEARYEPAKGVLRLKGVDQDGRPRVADERIAIEGDAIELTLEGRKMVAAGAVKTQLQGSARTPGLLNKEQPANVSAASLHYEGHSGRAVYKGSAQLWQGDTAIRGDSITIDQENGNLVTIGNARSTLNLEGATSIGRAEEIRYEDASRQITYRAATPPLAVVTTAPPAPIPAAAPAQLSGPQGNLKADRIEVMLAKTESRMERLEAYKNVSLRVDKRSATAARLTYHVADERYVMSGAPAEPVKVIEECRETTGKTLTFFKSTDRIIVDGNEEIRTRTTSGGPCAQTPPR